jgi:hypothetical protein
VTTVDHGDHCGRMMGHSEAIHLDEDEQSEHLDAVLAANRKLHQLIGRKPHRAACEIACGSFGVIASRFTLC